MCIRDRKCWEDVRRERVSFHSLIYFYLLVFLSFDFCLFIINFRKMTNCWEGSHRKLRDSPRSEGNSTCMPFHAINFITCLRWESPHGMSNNNTLRSWYLRSPSKFGSILSHLKNGMSVLQNFTTPEALISRLATDWAISLNYQYKIHCICFDIHLVPKGAWYLCRLSSYTLEFCTAKQFL